MNTTSPLPPATTQVAFLGIGLMGKPMVQRLLDAGYHLRLWNRTPAKAQALAGATAIACASIEEAVSDAQVVITMLENGSVVDENLYQSRAYTQAPAGTLFIDMSSIPPDLAREHGILAQAAGCAYLDAPVSGGTAGAAQGTLSIMAGGDAADFERARPLFECLGTPLRIGPVGSGQLAKLANQAIVGITIGAVSEALLLAAAGGADPAAVRQALGGGFAGSRILELHGQRMLTRDFEPGATARVQLKDLQTILDTARSEGLCLPLTQRVYEEYRGLVNDGHQELDHSALLLQLEKLNSPQKLS